MDRVDFAKVEHIIDLHEYPSVNMIQIQKPDHADMWKRYPTAHRYTGALWV